MNPLQPALFAFGAIFLAAAQARAEPPVVAGDMAPLSAEAKSSVQETPPPGTRGTLALTGTLVFAGWYGIAIGESYAWPKAPEAAKLRIPVIGPWFAVAKAGCAPAESNCTTAIAAIRAIVAGVSAVAQVGGLGVLVESAFLPGPSRRVEPAPKAAVAPMFFASPDNIGLGVSGSF